jgi:hypothetical protein
MPLASRLQVAFARRRFADSGKKLSAQAGVVFVVVAKIRPHYGEGEEAFVMSLMHATTAA